MQDEKKNTSKNKKWKNITRTYFVCMCMYIGYFERFWGEYLFIYLLNALAVIS